MRTKTIAFAGATVTLAIIFSFLAGEISARIYLFYKYYRNTGAQILILDDLYGWRVAPNYSFQGQRRDISGANYPVTIQTDSNGFRISRHLKNKHAKKIMFLGDSFTLAIDASDDKTYYGVLSQMLGVDAYAYGSGGYGTLQEYMILEDYFDAIQPNAVVLQFCNNDFINNSYDLEINSFQNNNAMRRPYMDSKGVISYAMPGGFPQKFPRLRRLINKYSRFLYFVCSRIDKAGATKRKPSIETTIAKHKEAFPPYKQSVEATQMILEKIRNRVPKEIPVYAFCVGEEEPFRTLSQACGITFIEGISQAVRSAENQGEIARARDGAHWNETGHKIAAHELFNGLSKYFGTPNEH